MASLRQDPDVKRSISDQRRRERELRLAKREAVRQGDRGKAFELGEYGRQNGIDQRGVRQSEQVLADAQARVAGQRADLAAISAANERTRKTLAEGPTSNPKPETRTVNPNAKPLGGDKAPGRATALASPVKPAFATPEENARANALAREAMGGAGEFGATAMLSPMQQSLGWDQGIQSTDRSPNRNLGIVPKAPATPQVGGSPSRSQILAQPNPVAGSLPARTPALMSPAPEATKSELILPKGESAPSGYVAVGLRGSNTVYRNDADTLALDATVRRENAQRGSSGPERLLPADGIDPKSRRLAQAADRDTARAAETERRRQLDPEQRYAEDTAKRTKEFDDEFGTTGLDKAALIQERDSGQLDDDAYAAANEKIKRLTARDLYVRYGIDTRKRLRS